MAVQTTPQEYRVADKHALQVSTKGGSSVFNVDTLTLSAELAGRFSAQIFRAYRNGDAVEFGDKIRRVGPISGDRVLIEMLFDGDAFPRATLDSTRLVWSRGVSAFDIGIERRVIGDVVVIGIPVGSGGGGGLEAAPDSTSDFVSANLANLRLRLFVEVPGGKVNPSAVYAHDRIQFGPGGGTGPPDVDLSRGAANRLDLAAGDSLRIVSGFVDIDDIAVPANPGAGIRRLFTDTATGELSVRTSGGSTVSLEGAGGGGDVATDVIWDAKGDLAVATGADAAQKLAVGADGTILGALASEITGLVYLTRSGTAQLADIANAEAAGSDTTVPFGDHVHAHPSGLTANLHHVAFVQADADLLYDVLGGLSTHAALDTGVHGAGGDVLATDADITTHAGIATAHHIKYTDAEAVLAIEAEATLEFDAATVISTAVGALTLAPVSGSNLNINLGGAGDLIVNIDQLVVDTTAPGRVGIGTAVIPHGGIGAALFAIEGLSGSTADGPHIQVTASADDQPLVQLLNFSHDNIAFNFDMYFDGTWKSSSGSTGWQIYKIGSELQFNFDDAAGAGIANARTTAFRFFNTGQARFTVDGSGAGIQIGTDTHLFRGAANRLDLATGDDFRLVLGDIELVTGKVLDIFNAFGDAEPLARYSFDRIEFGPGGASALDNAIYRIQARDLRTDGFFSVTLDGFVLFPTTAESAMAYFYTAQDEANPRMSLNSDRLEFGPGGASALDIALLRGAANRLELAASDTFRTQGGTNRTVDLSTFISVLSDSAVDTILSSRLNADINTKFQIRIDGQFEWGPGGVAQRDVALLRGDANRLDLASGDSFRLVSGDIELVSPRFVTIFGAFGDTNPLARYSSDRLEFGPGGASAIDVSLIRGGVGLLALLTGSDFRVVGGDIELVTGQVVDIFNAFGDAQPLARYSDDQIEYGLGGASALDAAFAYGGAAGGFILVRSGTGVMLNMTISGELNPRAQIQDDRLEFGPGGAGALDVNLYRNAADVLRTDDTMIVDRLGVNTTSLTRGRFRIDGPAGDVADGPNMELTVQDEFPVFQLFPFAHDNIAFHFDCFYDGTFRSSGNTSFQIYKIANTLSFRFALDTPAGDPIALVDAIVIQANAGRVDFPRQGGGTGGGLLIGGDVQIFRGAANRLDLTSGDSFRILSGALETDTINEVAPDVGVTVDGLLIQDGVPEYRAFGFFMG